MCTAVYDDIATANARELSTLTCTDGKSGNATIVYGADAQPDRVVYSVTGGGGGTINF
ncbi:hypothetical protein OU789_08675 [Halocynthiibacter sp. C4]|uniref:hypothetical protein n=1 Tax=Halocynthiibacter sp. C4 TaxID=2992758 RepID=UPI00237AE42F|nr:hypothetical protein [Halocynthiibacter sp. C4]MDE0589996.1 hypothetical protein [Halocynthiibacter sp. C4]